MFSGKCAIVTGAAKGIGFKTAATLAERGAGVMICDIDAHAAAEASAAINKNGGKSAFIAADVSKSGDLEQMIQTTVSVFGGIDILINNAGILTASSVEQTTEQEWDQIMAVNLKGAFFAMQKALPHMGKNAGKENGRIINIASLAGRMGGYQNSPAYAASKAGLIGVTMCAARRLAPLGITVNAVAPGTTQTDIISAFTEEKINSLKAAVPLGRLGQPEDVAEAVAFLASEGAKFITGAVIDVNGGAFMG
ncbi:MAG: SDR family oxidoreductase [Oscillospiraceae bacterium]|nr:SDR family oxidoreductase [Oscillospiraceae bacterium]